MKRKSNETTTPKHFGNNPDYKSAFSAAVSELVNGVRAGLFPDRTERSRAINALIDEYIASTGERPDSAELERLTNAVLHEELTDKSPDKMSREEYPIMSETQLARRVAGVHQKKGTVQKGESSINLASDFATDGNEYRVPKRRKRTVDEQIWMNQNVKSRNKARREKYAKWSKPSRTISYKIGEEAAVTSAVRGSMGFIL
jgi:hypothetical protein